MGLLLIVCRLLSNYQTYQPRVVVGSPGRAPGQTT